MSTNTPEEKIEQEHIEQVVNFFEYTGLDDSGIGFIKHIVKKVGGDNAFIDSMNAIYRGLDEMNILKETYIDDGAIRELYQENTDFVKAGFANATKDMTPDAFFRNAKHVGGSSHSVSEDMMRGMLNKQHIGQDEGCNLLATRFMIHYVAFMYGFFYRNQVDAHVYDDSDAVPIDRD